MINELTSMLSEDESLEAPIYGCLMQGRLCPRNYFGFFAITDNNLLIAILNPLNGKKIDWYNKVPLDIKKVNIKKSIIPKQYVAKIFFKEGNPCKIRMSKALLCGDFVDQKINVEIFLNNLSKYAKKA